ncbi:MAG: hypothetical protein ACP5EN_11180 [Rhodovulum sp.]
MTVEEQARTHAPMDEFHERHIEFTQLFGGDEFFEDGLLKAIDKTFELTSIFFGEDVATKGYDTMVRAALPGEDHSRGWQYCLDDAASGLYSELPVGHVFHDLYAYGHYGIVLTTSRTAQQREEVLSKQIEVARQLLQLLPLDAWELEAEDLVKNARRAIVRWTLDMGDPVTAEELALLSGKARQTIKNKLAGKYAEISGSHQRIEAAEALAWLSVQKDFRMSIWREQDDTEALEEEAKMFAEVRFIPVARDGSCFHPGLRKDGVFLVDAEGREQSIPDFDDALAVLQKMPWPEWRRPAEGGRWTRVRGVDWRRMTMEDLEVLAGSTTAPAT